MKIEKQRDNTMISLCFFCFFDKPPWQSFC